MESSRLENLPPPPGIIRSIKAGFDAIAAHIPAMSLPLLLNVFMWLGPRLRMTALFEAIKGDLVAIWQGGGMAAQDIQRVLGLYENAAVSVNLFWLLRTLPIGISSLLLPQKTDVTPLGVPAVWQVSALSLPFWCLLLMFLGWVGGGLYFRHVSRAVASNEESAPGIPRIVSQTILINIFCSLLLMMIGAPLLLILFLFIQWSAILANLYVLFVCLASMWIVVPLFFWPHGVFVKRQNVITSILSSIQLARFTLPMSSMFVILVFLLAAGLNFLWRIPPEDSWMTLVGILAHAFVTTALLAGSFIYYRDMSAWMQEVTEKFRPNPAVKQA
jgi:hypothetical protein